MDSTAAPLDSAASRLGAFSEVQPPLMETDYERLLPDYESALDPVSGIDAVDPDRATFTD
jgi:hypothetical protein